MKRKVYIMKKLSVFLILMLTLVAALFSCNKKSNVPAGMKLAGGSEEFGFYLYVPSEWTASSFGEVAGAHISTVDTTTVTLTEIKAPDSAALTDEALVSYYRDDIKNLKFEDIKFTTDGEACLLGNADKAYKFVFEFTYGGVKNKQMQIIASYKGHAYLFTYQSSGELMTEDKTYFDYHSELASKVIKEIEFTERRTVSEEQPSDPDGDGYYLASSKKISGFELYAPVSARCEYSNGMVSLKLGEGANLSLSKATNAGVSVDQYFKDRMEDIKSYTEGFTVELDAEGEPKYEMTKLGELNKAILYQYSYTYNGTKYCVYQIFAVDTFNGYVLTYTATEAAYETNLSAVKEIISRIKF